MDSRFRRSRGDGAADGAQHRGRRPPGDGYNRTRGARRGDRGRRQHRAFAGGPRLRSRHRRHHAAGRCGGRGSGVRPAGRVRAVDAWPDRRPLLGRLPRVDEHDQPRPGASGWSKAHRAAGQSFVAAPVFGRPEAADARKLWVVAAGAAENVERVRPIIDAVGTGSTVVGEEPWQANVVKLAGNFTIAAMIETLGEAFALARKSGVEPKIVPRGHQQRAVQVADLPDLRNADRRGPVRSARVPPAAWA